MAHRALTGVARNHYTATLHPQQEMHMENKPTEKKPVKKLTLTRETIRALNQGTQNPEGVRFSPCKVCKTTI